MSESELRHQVNGATLPQFQGKNVSIFGEILKSDPSGRSFDIKTSDNMIVSVSVNQPLTEPISGLVEVIGKGQGRNSMVCEKYLQFSDELAATYDAEIDNAAVTFLNSTENVWS
ncbi:replication protein A 14 kDa subunit isoform X1 [Nilaparvata lugens]|uniref:replication protein A 14 kDa subunit isoform X1 n=1 Tax=Nilaparvata lugens TaxID=108931 RepID=UPI000B992CB6|nr:replication protein A 14 kDa subunit isoform X1 [Nilaparvata lugens]